MKAALALAAAVVATACGPLFLSEYGVSFAIQLLIFMVLGYSWNIIGGYAGYPHFGQTSFFGVGAYVGALLMLHAGFHWAAAAAAAGLFGLVIALPLGGVMLRLKGPYFAIGMFALTRVWEALAYGWSGLTQGGTGLYLPPAYNLVPIYYVTGGMAVAMILLTWWIDNSRFGLQLLAIREDEGAAESLGIKTTRLKITAFTISAIAPSACGSLFATYLSFIDPTTAFAPINELTTIAMVLFGGLGTVLGPLVGAVLLSVLNEALWARFQELYLGMVGVAIAVVVLFMPRGIVNLFAKRGWLPAGRGAFRRLAPGARKEASDGRR
ncbi:MAG: branched-chain amino acid ABC transporter permease [Alphaproteobacteria bacterium]